MKRRRKQRDNFVQSLFPFLAVLLSTMGALVLLLMLIVNQAQASKMYQEMAQLYAAGDACYTAYSWTLWMIFGVELWFRKNFLKEETTI